MVENQSQASGPLPALQGLPLLRPERAKLIVLEGIDLSGRTTQVQLLREWLLAQRYAVMTTAWRTSPLISDVLTRARTASPLQPLTYSLLYCADHLDRTQRVIVPALQRGEIVLADRYIYTAFARDEARGLNSAWVRNLYHFAIPPDIVFYLHISPDEAVRRRLALQQPQKEASSREVQDAKPKKAEKDDKGHKHQQKHSKEQVQSPTVTAQFPALTQETLESFRDFERKMYTRYQNMQKEFGFTVIEGSQYIDLIQATVRRAVMHLLLDT
jgi:dTMP kinase